MACGSGAGRRAGPTPGAPRPTTSPSGAVAAGPCRGERSPATYAHVLLVVMENHDYDQVAGHSPYLEGLATRCGLAADYRAVAHPSLPNYIAMTSGGTQGIATDCTSCSTDAPSVFSQLGRGGWKSYEEDLPGAGFTGAAAGNYAKKHDPAAYFSTVAADFATQSVPLGTPTAGPLAGDLAAGTLPRFGFVTPDLCHDEHNCPVSAGDTWLSAWVPVILDSPAYRSGGTALFVTYDENDTSPGNRVYTVAVSPSVPPATVSTERFDHYSLLATVEDMLGLERLDRAASAVSMRPAFRL
jgi:phospholipase C